MRGSHCNYFLWSPWTWNSSEMISLFIVLVAISTFLWKPAHSTECMKQKYFVNLFGMPLNATVQCPMYFQWTVSDLCCYGKYDRFDQDPYCCYSDTYKLVLAVGLICLIVLGTSCIVFFCWAYNLPHHSLYILTCGHFHLNNWMKRNTVNGPYVDPSFYSGEPFWSRKASEIQPYPLRPMPPRIFYPAAPANIKFRWDSMASTGQMPLFIVASRQFTRNPYSARPSERSLPGLPQPGSNAASRSSSISTLSDAQQNNKYYPLLEFHVNMDEVEAAAELLEALKRIEEKGDKCLQIPSDIPEESAAQMSESVTQETPSSRQVTAAPHRTDNVLREIEDMVKGRRSEGNIRTARRLHHMPSVISELSYTEPTADAVITAVARRAQSAIIPPAPIVPYVPPSRKASLACVPTPPTTGSSFKDDPSAKEVTRVDVPYNTSRLPGSIPEN